MNKHLYPKKSLGQNFLTSVFVVKEMVRQARVTKKDFVLEIGGGKGILTNELVKTGATIVCVEKDERMVSYLKDRFKEEKNFTIISGDILSFDPNLYFKNKPYRIVANIPYNITGAILSYFLEQKKQPEYMALMVQKEVAERICAKNKKESILSISVKAYGTPRIIRRVSSGAFFPKPNVDSALLEIADISKKLFKNNTVTESFFFQTVKAGFAHKRKKLASNLQNTSTKKNVTSAFTAQDISLNVRAEDLRVSDWFALASFLNRFTK